MSYQNNIFVFDDIISKDYQNSIKEKLFNNAGWRFVTDVTNPKNTQQRPGFSHYFVSDEKETSKLHSDLLPLIKASCEKINYKYNRVLQGRSFLQLPLNLKDKTIDTPHIDVSEFKHRHFPLIYTFIIIYSAHYILKLSKLLINLIGFF